MSEEVKNQNEELELEDQTEEIEEIEDESGANGPEEKGKNKGNNKTGKSFTQEQVSAMMAKEKRQGRSSVYKELGIDPKDKKTVAMFKAFVESQKSEEQKNAERESEEASRLEEANQRAAIAEAKAEAMLLGVQPKYVEDLIALCIPKLGDDESDIKTIIGEYKTKYPDWFKEDDDEKGKGKEEKKGQKGTGSSVKTAKEKGGKEETKGLGARLAAQRKTSNKKSSYWGNK